MVTNLPTELLRSFAAIVDTGSMAKATERVFVTQSALSLQIKRLEELLQRPLFLREGARKLVLTPAGTELLAYARQMLDINDQAVVSLRGEAVHGPVRVGMVQDFAEVLLSGVLRQFTLLHPEAQLEVRAAGTAELQEHLREGRLDVALCVSPIEEREVIRRAQTLWIGDAALAEREVLPLAVLTEPCAFRNIALKALEKADIAYRVVVQTPHLTGLRAAVAGGLGVTCRTPLFIGGAGLGAIESNRLPYLPEIAYALYARNAESPSVARLGALVRKAVEDLP
ncbi:MAG: LysR substrate-binding domain-containing protein [Rhizomicrobium sp.]